MSDIERFDMEIGLLLRKLVREAIDKIRYESAKFTVRGKVGKSGDIVTSADIAAQSHYVEKITEAYPWIGIIAEEDDLRRKCTLEGYDIYITIDPLDGTQAFARGQSSGVGTMVAVVRNNVVIAAYVGDVNTCEIYGFAPDRLAPSRMRFNIETDLNSQLEIGLSERYALLDCVPWDLPSRLQKLVSKPGNGGLFKNVEINHGSFGIMCARLWKGEVGMLLFEPSYVTPWDFTPVIGVMKQMGFVCLRYNPDNYEVQRYYSGPPTRTHTTKCFTIFIHETHVGDVNKCME